MLIHRALNMGCHQGLYICLVIEHLFRKDLQVRQSFIVCSTYYLWCSTEFNFSVIFYFLFTSLFPLGKITDFHQVFFFTAPQTTVEQCSNAQFKPHQVRR